MKITKSQTTSIDKFRKELEKRSKFYKNDVITAKLAKKVHEHLAQTRYTYSFFWMGLPIIQLPQEIQLMQEVIWEVKPDLIIETGVAWGGSVIFSASMLSMLESNNYIKNGEVVGIELNLWPDNKKAITSHPFGKKVTLLEGSSIDESIVERVKEIAKNKKKIMVILDSNHTHDHVLAELKAYGPLVTPGSYCMVADTFIEDVPRGIIKGRPWSKGNNPKTALFKFLKENKNFKIDNGLDSKLIFTYSPSGWLKRIK